jgi:hypothetical protein
MSHNQSDDVSAFSLFFFLSKSSSMHSSWVVCLLQESDRTPTVIYLNTKYRKYVTGAVWSFSLSFIFCEKQFGVSQLEKRNKWS